MHSNKMMSLAVSMLILAVVVVVADAASVDTSASCVPATERQSCGDFSCNRTSKFCGLCVDDDGCTERALYCDTSKGECAYKSLKDGGDGLTVLAPLVAIAVCATGVVAGLGGGGILVPAYWLILGVPVEAAVGLSQITIVGQSVFNVFLQVQRRHPDHNGEDDTASWPLVNYEMMLLLLPFALVGTLLGKMAGSVSPAWLRVGMLVLLLGALMVRLVYLMIQQRKKDALSRERDNATPNSPDTKAVTNNNNDGEDNNESSRPRKGDDQELGEVQAPATANEPSSNDANNEPTAAPTGDETSPSTANGDNDNKEEEGAVDGDGADAAAPPPCLASMDLHDPHPANSKPQYPVIFIFIAVVVFCVQLMFSIIRSKTIGVVDCGSGAFIGVIVAAVVWNTFASFATRTYLTYLRSHNDKGNLPPSVTPFLWTPLTTIVFPISALVAGGAAAWFGIGGGMVLNSLLLESEIVPAAVSATGGVTTMMTALQSAAIFIVDGELQWDYALVLLAAGFIGTAIGQLVLMKKIREWKAQYLIIAALLVILVGSMVTQIAMGIYQTVKVADEGGSLGFVALCK